MKYPASNQSNIALTAEILYLLNLLFLPGVAFIILSGLFLAKYKTGSELSRSHLKQTLCVSVFGGSLLLITLSAIMLFGGIDSAYSWVFALLYFTTIHSSLILFGVVGLVKALNHEAVIYPLIGKWFTAE